MPPASCNRIGKVADAVMHTKRAAPRQFRLLLLIDVVYPLRRRPLADLAISRAGVVMAAA